MRVEGVGGVGCGGSQLEQLLWYYLTPGVRECYREGEGGVCPPVRAISYLMRL